MSEKYRNNLFYVDHHKVSHVWSMRSHAHRHHEMIIVVRGSIKAVLPNKTIIANAGDVLLYPSGCMHEECAHGQSDLETFLVGFTWDRPVDDIPLCVCDGQGRIRLLAEWLCAERESYYKKIKQLRASFLQSILAEYLRIAKCLHAPLIERARAYAHSHIMENFSLDDLAKHLDISKYHFVRTYCNLTGLTPMKDVRRIRLETARYLILTTNQPLKTIAPLVGFSNVSHLSRLLIDQFGLGVRQLRNVKAKS